VQQSQAHVRAATPANGTNDHGRNGHNMPKGTVAAADFFSDSNES